MADFQVSASQPSGWHKPRARRLSTHIDFTPMVDLGFLLITFFMLTTIISKPTLMPLVMPKAAGEPVPLKQSKVLTILLGANDKVYSYEGLDVTHIDTTDFSHEGLRQTILRKKDKVEAIWGLQSYADPNSGELKKGSHLNIIIKAFKNARYKNLVDALDEMAICQIRYYSILDPSEEEIRRIKN